MTEPAIEQRSPEAEQRPLSVLRGRLERRGWLLALSLAVTLGCLWFLHSGALPVLPAADVLALVPAGWVLLYGLAFAVVEWVRAVRWISLVKPLAHVPSSEVVATNLVFFGALLVLPLRLGELVRPALLRRPGRLSAWQVMGLVGAERVVDGLMSSVVLLGSLVFVRAIPGQSQMATYVRPLAFTMAGTFGVLALALIVAYYQRALTLGFVTRLLSPLSPALARFVRGKVEGALLGLRVLEHPRHAAEFLLLSVLYWVLNVAAVLCLLAPAGLSAASLSSGDPASASLLSGGVVQAATVIGVLSLGTLLPGAPGFFGTFQLSIYAALSVTVPESELGTRGAAVVFWLYVVQLVVILVAALAALPYAAGRLRASLVASPSAVAIDQPAERAPGNDPDPSTRSRT